MTADHHRTVCLHEAGHVVVAWRVLGLVPEHSQVHPGPPLHANTLVQIDRPRTRAQTRALAAYHAAGRAALREALAMGALGPSSGERDGYGWPDHLRSDAGRIAALEQWAGLALEAEALDRAGKVVRAEWGAVLRVAGRLEGGLPLHQGYLGVVLEG